MPLIDSPRHASFPSAHSLESHMIALALTDVRGRQSARVLNALADRIARNREVAGVHYPSDSFAGKQIAQKAFLLLQACPIYRTVLQLAQQEPGGVGQMQPPPECAPPPAVASGGTV